MATTLKASSRYILNERYLKCFHDIKISLGKVSKNKTKYFCSDSMMKYALREGLERAKRELRESY